MKQDKENTIFEDKNEQKEEISMNSTVEPILEEESVKNYSVNFPKSAVDVNAENRLLNTVFKILSLFGILWIAFLTYKYDSYWKYWGQFAPENYDYPSLYDFKYVLLSFVFIVILKFSLEYISGPLMYLILHDKYKEITTGDKETEDNYLKQMKTSFFKLTWYILIVLVGFRIIPYLEFFPKEVFGNGDLRAFYSKGVPYTIISFQRPELLKIYYMASLGFTFTDSIFLIFVHKKRSDFDLMVLHHVLTIGLVAFSYLTNNIHAGSVIFFLHDLTDIFVYLTRIVINTFINDILKYIHCALFLFIFVYFRIYILSDIAYTIYFYSEWTLFLAVLWHFLCVLILMHIYWSCKIVERFLYKKLEDVGKVRKKNK